MTPEAEALGRRAIAVGLTVPARHTMSWVVGAYSRARDGSLWLVLDGGPTNWDAVPDLDDPATLGVLMAMLPIGWALIPVTRVVGRHRVVIGWAVCADDDGGIRRVTPIPGNMPAETAGGALVAALEAAGAR
jgi:hypothetical protein